MRLMIVVTGLDVGGTERHLAAVLPVLAARGYRCTVFSLRGRGALAKPLEAAGIKVIAPPLGYALAAPWLWFALWRRAPQVVHFFLPAAYLIGGLTSLLSPVPQRVMSRRSLNLYQRRRPVLARLERWLHGRMAALVGNSEAVVADLRAEGAPPERIKLIRNGVAVEPLADRARREEVRRALGIDAAAFVMAIVANLIPYKGHGDLLGALGRIADALPANWRLLCAGRDEGIGASLRHQAQHLGLAANIVWLGQRNDVPALFAASDLALLCSHEEGSPNAVLEAMAAGLPVIATTAGGSAEVVVDGSTGILVPPQAADALAGAILQLARDAPRRSAMGAAGRRRVEEVFSLRRCVDDYDSMYTALGQSLAAAARPA
ncbi:MAG TPA: glycosyltransferase [Candidatus Cybelea sp.]|nr:glycosyltransferase [Candidatus Cybelea sp.]